MKRFTILLLIALLFVGSASAKSLILKLQSGLQVFYTLSKTESVHMQLDKEGNIALNGEKYLLQNVTSMRISDSDYAGDPGTQQGATASIEETRLQWSGAYTVTRLDGTVVLQGTDELDLEQLPAGTYVITNGSQTLKIQKR